MVAVFIVLATTSSPGQAQVVAEAGPLSSLTIPRAGSAHAPSTPDQGVGGATYGITIGGGWIGTWGGLFEASVPRYLSFNQTSSLFETSGRLRDTTLSGLLYIGHVRLVEFVVGFTRLHQELESKNTAIPGRSSLVFDRTRRTRNRFAGTGGIGVEARLSRHISVVPRLRVHIINRDDEDFPFRLSSFVFQPAVVFRVRVN